MNFLANLIHYMYKLVYSPQNTYEDGVALFHLCEEEREVQGD